MRTATTLFLGSLFLPAATGCTVIEAPEDFDELTAYLYEHLPTGGEVLYAGTRNLDTWLLENHTSLEEGYLVQNLSLEAIRSAVPDYEEAEILVGVAMSRDYDFEVEAFAHHYYWDDPENPSETTTWLEDGDCFLAHECDSMSYERDSHTTLPLGITVSTTFRAEGGWSETELGPALVQRRYLTGPAEVSVNWIHLLEEFGLEVTLPLEGGRARRIAGSWVAIRLGDLPTPEDFLIQMGLNELESSLEWLEGALEGEVEERAEIAGG